MYMLTIFMMALSSHSFAEGEQTCPEGKVFDDATQTCIDAPVEVPQNGSGQ